jgi:hypothetical protein
MRIMFLISIVALLALLWASISIASHVRRARRRHRSLKASAAPPYFAETTSAPGHPDFSAPRHTGAQAVHGSIKQPLSPPARTDPATSRSKPLPGIR